MAEGGGAIDSDVKPIQAEEVVKPERTLNQSVKETAAFLGILLFQLIGLSAGPLIILASTVFFLISLIFKR